MNVYVFLNKKNQFWELNCVIRTFMDDSRNNAPKLLWTRELNLLGLRSGLVSLQSPHNTDNDSGVRSLHHHCLVGEVLEATVAGTCHQNPFPTTPAAVDECFYWNEWWRFHHLLFVPLCPLSHADCKKGSYVLDCRIQTTEDHRFRNTFHHSTTTFSAAPLARTSMIFLSKYSPSLSEWRLFSSVDCSNTLPSCFLVKIFEMGNFEGHYRPFLAQVLALQTQMQWVRTKLDKKQAVIIVQQKSE